MHVRAVVVGGGQNDIKPHVSWHYSCEMPERMDENQTPVPFKNSTLHRGDISPASAFKKLHLSKSANSVITSSSFYALEKRSFYFSFYFIFETGFPCVASGIYQLSQTQTCLCLLIKGVYPARTSFL